MPIPYPPTVAAVARIAAVSDAVVRNLQITQCYAELSAAMTQRTGPSANWCTFATWASKQAGQTIRGEDLARRLRQWLADAPAVNEAPIDPALAPTQAAAAAEVRAAELTLWQAFDPRAPFVRAAEAVARGNKKVFEEIAREFARFYAGPFLDVIYTPSTIEAFCGELHPGDPPEGQHYLRRAFTHYYTALFTPDANARAELLLLANIEIGYHEQTRLQPEIVAALDAPILDLRQVGLGSGRGPLAGLLDGVQPHVDAVVDRFLGRVRYGTHLVITEFMMTIGLPEGKHLRLGRDLRADYPPSLVHLRNPDLRVLLAEVDPTIDSIDATGAVDWGRLTDRLHFIVDMFRCYQEWPPLLLPPFTVEQAADIQRGRRPSGNL
jgi:hypothetical protein